MGLLDKPSSSPSEATQAPLPSLEKNPWDRAHFETTLLKCHTIKGMMREIELLKEQIKEYEKNI